VYHSAAVEQFRRLVLTPFFESLDGSIAKVPGSTKSSKSFTATEFLAEVTRIGTAHLTTTLDILSPANGVNVFSADAQVSC
jgi:hypothetical protein